MIRSLGMHSNNNFPEWEVEVCRFKRPSGSGFSLARAPISLTKQPSKDHHRKHLIVFPAKVATNLILRTGLSSHAHASNPIINSPFSDLDLVLWGTVQIILSPDPSPSSNLTSLYELLHDPTSHQGDWTKRHHSSFLEPLPNSV